MHDCLSNEENMHDCLSHEVRFMCPPTYYPSATTYVTLISQAFYNPIGIATAYVSIFLYFYI